MHYLMQIVSGLLSWLSGKRQKSLATEPENLDMPKVLVHKIISGPYSLSDDPDWDGMEDDVFWIEVLIECEGHMSEVTIAHEDFDAIYKIVKHVNGPTIEPYVIGEM